MSTTRLWFSNFMLHRVRLYPYFWFHYLFAEVLRQDAACRSMWASSRRLSAGPPHKLQDFGLTREISPALQQDIDSRATPLYKLNWKLDEANLTKNCCFEVLQRSHRVSSRVTAAAALPQVGSRDRRRP